MQIVAEYFRTKPARKKPKTNIDLREPINILVLSDSHVAVKINNTIQKKDIKKYARQRMYVRRLSSKQ